MLISSECSSHRSWKLPNFYQTFTQPTFPIGQNLNDFPSFQLENIYKNAHAGIRKDPVFHKKPEKKVTKKRFNLAKMTLEARKAKIAKHKADYMAKIHADVEA